MVITTPTQKILVDINMPPKGIHNFIHNNGKEYSWSHLPKTIKLVNDMEILSLYEECWTVYKALGLIPRSKPILGSFTNRAILGIIQYQEHYIAVHEGLLKDKAELKDTLLHEIAHYFTRYSNHNSNWKSLAYAQKTISGIDLSREGSSPSVDKWWKEFETKKGLTAKYKVFCLKCNNTWHYQTLCKAVKEPHKYQCCKCKCNLVSNLNE